VKGFMIAGTASGCGKSTVAMGLNRLFSRKGYRVQPWKCGPDYIDPGFHTIAAGRPCRNLDTRLMDRQTVRELFHYHGGDADLSLVEGVMGYYDGDAGRFAEGSSYDLSRMLELPVYLVLDVRSAAQSAGAMALGFREYRKDAPLAGFILNRVGSQRHAAMVREAVEEATGLPVAGILPKDDGLTLPERHLGLVMAEEQDSDGELDACLERLADLMEEHIDTELLLKGAELRDPEENPAGRRIYPGTPQAESRPVIAVARDEAFAFYYRDNLDLLESRGARLVSFSPVRDRALPDGACAVYFGGGYPERFSRELSENRSMLASVRRAAESGMPLYGECGGYMYLAESLKTADGVRRPMAGVLPGRVAMTGGLRALGYGDVLWKADTFMAPAGTRVPGHLFHWSCLEQEVSEERIFRMDRRDGPLAEGFCRKNVLASYVHFHFASCPELAEGLVRAARKYRDRGVGNE